MKDEIEIQFPDDENTERVLKKYSTIVGVGAFEHIPENKSSCLLITQDDRLRRQIMRTAHKNNFIVLYNPETITSEHCKKLFAFIMDKSHKNTFRYPEYLDNRYIDIDFGIDIINDLLPKLQSNYLEVTKDH